MTESASDPKNTPSDDRVQSSVEHIIEAMSGLKAAGDSGASWFFWIAGLSLVNEVTS